MKILLCMVTRMTNRGVDALVASKTAELRRTFEGCEIDVITRDYVVNKPFLEARNIGLLEDPFYGWRWNALSKAGPLLAPLVHRLGGAPMEALRAVKARLPGYDLAVLTGGDNMSSDYGSPADYLVLPQLLIDAGVPVVMMAQSIGPFREQEHRDIFVAVARRCALVTVRETASLRYVTEDLGLPPEKVALTADTAFLLEPAPAEFARKAMLSFGLDPERPVIALSVSGGITQFASSDGDRHLEALERLSRRLLDETGAQILLIPHVEDHDPSNNDMIVADKLLRRMDFDLRMRLAKGYFTSNEFKAILARCDMVIAERMHVAVGGLSSGVTTFVLGYSVKGHGIMSDCIGANSLEAGLVVPVGDFIQNPAEDEKVLAAWRNRAHWAQVLAANLPEIKARSRQNFAAMPAIVAARKAG